MEDQKKKLAFFEIGKGKLYAEFQAIFEQAQIESKERNVEVSCVLKIKVLPPATDDERFGNVSYEVDLKTPPKKSRVFTTELIDGVIINDGESLQDILQLSLDLPTQNVLQMRKAADL